MKILNRKKIIIALETLNKKILNNKRQAFKTVKFYSEKINNRAIINSYIFSLLGFL